MALYVLTGEVGSGKTTVLLNEIKERSDVGGFLSPVKDKIRQFYFIRNMNYIPMENNLEHSESSLAVGKYLFDSNAFNYAKVQFGEDWNSGLRLLILDEFGPLEFNNQGLLPELNPFLIAVQNHLSQDILVVVRITLLASFLKLYTVKQVISKSDVSELFREILR